MRRLALLILLSGLTASLVGLTLYTCARPAAVTRLALSLADAVGPRRAAAQEMKFQPVPAESSTALDRSHARRERRTEAAPPVAPPPPPEPTEPPESPETQAPVNRVGDITRIGSDIHIEKDEAVQGTVVAVGGDVTVDGTVHGDVVAAGGSVFLNASARVEGDVACIGGELHEEPGSYVSGEKVTVGGWGTRSAANRILRRHRLLGLGGYGREGWSSLMVLGSFLWYLVAIALTALIAWLFHGRITAGAQVMKRQPGLSLGIGALVHALFIPSIIALAIVMVILCITIIGIPLALAALFGYVLFFVAFWLFGLVVGATVLGERILSRRGSPPSVWQSALAGVLLVGGVKFLGRVLEALGVMGIDAIGKLLVVLALLTTIVLGTIGGGAWLKWEFEAGLLGRWRGRRGGAAGTAVGTPSPYGPPPASPYGPPAPPSAPAPASQAGVPPDPPAPTPS
ncbi:MAG TPA: polymer-forming cytoskeletal protein [Terriglobales bacterium]|nr:polymer-forming cytoskeletal protein [Terriglobales bacterium]